MTLLNTPVPSWTVVCLVNFSETIPCCSLLSAALPFSRDHTGRGQLMSSRVYSYIQFHAINEHLLLSQQNFIWPIFLFLCSSSWHTPTQQPLHRVLLLKILTNSLSLNRRDLLSTDIWHQVNLDNSAERDSLLLWHASVAGCLRETDVPPVLPFLPSSPALLLPPLQTRQNIRCRHQGSSWLAVVHMVLHMMVITTDLVKQNVFLLSLSRKPLLFWNTSHFPKITNDKAQIRHILWFYNARVSTHIFRIEIDIIFFIDDAYVFVHTMGETATGIMIGKCNDPNYLIEHIFCYFNW